MREMLKQKEKERVICRHREIMKKKERSKVNKTFKVRETQREKLILQKSWPSRRLVPFFRWQKCRARWQARQFFNWSIATLVTQIKAFCSVRQLVFNGFNQHYQTSVHFHLSRNVNKSQQHQKKILGKPRIKTGTAG